MEKKFQPKKCKNQLCQHWNRQEKHCCNQFNKYELEQCRNFADTSGCKTIKIRVHPDVYNYIFRSRGYMNDELTTALIKYMRERGEKNEM